MGTNNFYNKNASKIFSNFFKDDFDYQDLKENLSYELKKLEYDTSFNDYDNNRNYGGKYLGLNYWNFENKSYSIKLEIMPVIRSGYYEGANLDYDFQIEIEGLKDQDGYTVEDLKNYDGYMDLKKFRTFVHETKGLKTIGNQAIKKFDQEIKKLESIFNDFSSHKLIKTAQFSNGEALYEATI